MTNAESSEVFTFIPGSEAGNRSVAFILPDFSSDPECIAVRENDRGKDLRRRSKTCEKSKGAEHARFADLPAILFS
jgi:hypothetical protein